MNKTTHYQLNQWDYSDGVLMDDFNEDNAKLDAALKAEADARAAETAERKAADAALQTELAKKGTCSIGFLTYTGTNTYGPNNPTRITFPRMPAAYIITGYEGIMVGQGRSSWAALCCTVNSRVTTQTIDTSWSGTTLSMYHRDYSEIQMNKTGTHVVIAFYSES